MFGECQALEKFGRHGVFPAAGNEPIDQGNGLGSAEYALNLKGTVRLLGGPKNNDFLIL